MGFIIVAHKVKNPLPVLSAVVTDGYTQHRKVPPISFHCIEIFHRSQAGRKNLHIWWEIGRFGCVIGIIIVLN